MHEAAAEDGKAVLEGVATGGGGNSDRGRGLASGSGAAGSSMVAFNWLAAGTGVVALLLYAAQQSLRLPSAFGIEDLLGWSDPETIRAAVANWCPPASERWRVAAAYVLVDTAFFMPFYGALILAAARGIHESLQTGPAPFARITRVVLLPLTFVLVAVLWICDALENFGAAQRIALATWPFLVSLGVAASLLVALLATAAADRATQQSVFRRNAIGLLVAGVAIALIVMLQDPRAACEAVHAGRNAPFGFASAHRFKFVAAALALLPVAGGALAWWFGVDLDLDNAGQRQLAELRAAWRSGVSGVVGRTRYVLALLTLFAAFTLVLDQCRDVLLSLAGPMGEKADRDFLSLMWRGFILVVGAVSVAMLSYSCWLWTRLAAMVNRPGLALPGGHDVLDQIGGFARGWARAVAMLPLVIVCLLIAHTAGDAVTAARAGPGTSASSDLTSTLGYLSLFGGLTILSGYLFLELRRKLSLARPSDYYNSETDAFELLRTGTLAKPQLRDVAPSAVDRAVPHAGSKGDVRRMTGWRASLARTASRVVQLLVPLTRPIILPLLGLALMVSIRVGMAAWPNIAAQAPATLALLALAMTWWMGVLGALTLAEQRQTIPWALVVVVVMGALSWADLVDNHVLPLEPIRGATEAAIAALRTDGVIVTVLLAVMGTVWWLAATYRPGRLTANSQPPPQVPNLLPRILIAVISLAVAAGGLVVVDRSSVRNFGPPQPSPNGKTLGPALKDWVGRLPTPSETDNRVFLVASEGGGIRSAYWTAQILAGLHDKIGNFDQRVVVLSGVSGGALGEAVYRACLRQMPPDPSVSECVRTRFAHLDPLSPLIGGFLFEDAFARLLPLHAVGGFTPCRLPACGHLSRALGFEREWTRQFPHLADAFGRTRPGEPELMLNSTWVESGNRATFSTMRLAKGDIPASEDAVARLGADPSLVTAAHAAARFPFINPLAAIVPVAGAEGADKVVGHLADGGYHDNSGAESLADVWRALHTAGLPAGWHAQLVLIRNGQVKPNCERRSDKDPDVRCLTEARSQAIDLAAPLTKSQWNLYVDALGPVVAVVNVSGIGARGRQAPAALSSDLATLTSQNASGAQLLPVWLLDQTSEAKLVPLGWYLSPAAREALDVQAQCALVSPSCPVQP